MKISVVTPLLDGIRFLPDLLDCLSGQSHADWEHIIVDGGSTDGSLERAREWCAAEPRARLLTEPGLGLYPSIFRGFDEATGDIFCWLNCDDLFAPWTLAVVAEYAGRTGADWLTGFPGAWDEAGRLCYVRPYGHYPQEWIRKGWFHNGFLGYLQQESMFFTPALLAKLGDGQRDEIRAMKLAGDFLLWRRFADHSPLSVIPTALAGFRFHDSNRSRDHAALYEEEVRSTGAPFPNGHIVRITRALFRRRAAKGALKQMDAADLALHARLGQPRTG